MEKRYLTSDLALGAYVVVFTTSPNKKEDALRLGADDVIVSRNADEMNKHAGSSLTAVIPKVLSSISDLSFAFPPISI